MVNSPSGCANEYVSKLGLAWVPPCNGIDLESKRTRSMAGPIWQLEDFKNCARRCVAGDRIALIGITRGVSHDMQALKLTFPYVAEIVLLLDQNQHFIGSVWCQATPSRVPKHPDTEWYPCDAYRIEVEQDMDTGETLLVDYYLKMSRTLNGRTLLMVSVHESEFD